MSPSRVVLAAQRALLAKDALQYTLSLSAGVQDALFSYWRLPLAARRVLAGALPSVELDGASGARVDWERLARCIRAPTAAGASATSTETAWGFALQAEAAMMNGSARLTCELRVTHGAQVGALLELLQVERGEFYMAFVVLVTVLEKALYDLHHHQQQQELERSSAAAATSKRKNLILRDLLHSEALALALPDGLLLLLKLLFLPTGLNLRNLVWHGFVVPAEFPRCFGCLLVVLLAALPAAAAAPVVSGEQLFDVRSFDDRFVLRDELKTLFRLPASGVGLEELLASANSRFVPPGRRQLVRRAFTALVERGDELWFLFALLPVLEHAVRVQFVATNRERWGLSSEFGVAQVDAYYSTLDGFGQRDKHQVLLHARVAATPSGDGSARANQLYTALAPAALAVCLDLFMMAAGPNLRAKLCHGDADLSTLLPRGGSAAPGCSSMSAASQLVVLAWLVMCRDADTVPCNESTRAAVDTFGECYASSFHPFYQLQRALATALGAATQFAAVRECYARLELASVESGSEAMLWVAFPCAREVGASGRSEVGVLEKASRIGDFRELLLERDGLFTCAAAAALLTAQQHKAPAKGSFPELLVRLHTRLREVLRQLERHYETQHDGELRSAFLELLGGAAGARTSRPSEVGSIDSFLLALSDDDGLSVAACMLEVAASTQRAYRSFAARHRDLQTLVASGRARTNHRRSFLNSIFFLPIFERVQLLCLGLVEHQVLHLRSLAARTRSDSSAAPLRCVRARRFELLQRKLLLFATAFEGCAGGGGSDASAQKSAEKALLLALQFLDSKAVVTALS